MDKNKIHIDDLVRSRLSGAEEREPAGAWSSMRELLDKEMPVGPAAFNWRRMLGYATALLLAGSVTVGGYNYYRRALASQPQHTLAAHTAAASSPIHSSSTQQTGKATNVAALAITAANSQPAGSTRPSDLNNPNTPATSAPSGTIASGKSGVTAHPAAHNGRNHISGNPAASGQPIAAHHKGAAAVAVNSPANAASGQQPLPVAARSESRPATAAVVASSGSVLAKPSAALASGQELPNDRQQTASSLSSGTPKAPATALSNTNRPASRNTGSLRTLAGSSAPAPLIPAGNTPATVVYKDTIRQIKIAYRRATDQATPYKADTISVTNLVVDRPQPVTPAPHPQDARPHRSSAAPTASAPAPAKPPVIANAMNQPTAAASAHPVPQAAAASSAEALAAADNIKLVSLAQFKVASRFSQLWNAERFHLMVQSVKADLSRAQFYAGITGGLNASLFTPSTLAGFQAGLTGLLVFNDQWSIAGELKFYQRFNTGSSIKDNYVKQDEWVPGSYSVVNGTSYRQWNWRQDTVAHSYNFTTVQTIELPLMVRYNARRFFAEAGLNMMYAFAINAEEIDRPYGNATMVSRQMPATFTPESVSGNKPTIGNSDFGSRFGLGYALGIGYQITPAFQANMRLVHSVWDNAASVGAQKVSQNLYQTPSIQISIGYRFQQGKGK